MLVLRHPMRSSCLVLLAGSALGVPAAAQTWNGASLSDNNWTSGANWVGSVPPVNTGAANIVFGASSRVGPTVNVAYDVASITFNNTSPGFTLGGAGPLTIRAGGVTNNDSQNQTLGVPIVVSVGQTWNAAAGPLTVIGSGITLNAGLVVSNAIQPIQIGAALGGPGALSKSGAGAVILTGPNTYAGATTINQGTLTVGATNTLSDSSAMVIGAAGTLELNGFSDAIPSVVGDPGATISLGSGTLTVGVGADAATYTFGGLVNGTGNLIKAGSHAMILAGACGYTGTTTVNGGVLRLGASERLADGSDLVVNSSGGFDLGSFIETVDAVTITGGSITGSGSLNANSVSIQGGNIFARIGGPASVNKSNGATNAFFNGTGNTYAGATIVSGGTLVTNGINVLPDTTVVNVLFPGTLQITNFDDTVAGISGNGTINVLSATLTIGAGDVTSNFPGVIGDLDTGGNITKIGTGTLSLSNSSTYRGTTTVNAGVLTLVSAERLADTSDLVVNGGLFVVVDETLDRCTLNGGEIRATSLGNGTLRANSFTLNSGFVDATLVSVAGIVKSGAGTVTLVAPNAVPFTRVDSGVLVTGSDSVFGPATSNIALNGGTLRLSSPMSLNRPFFVLSPSTLETQGDVTLPNFSPNLSAAALTKTGLGRLTLGPGLVNLPSLSIAAGEVLLPAPALYQGTTLTISALSSLRLDGSLMALTGSLSNVGTLRLQGDARLQAATLSNSGVISGSGRVSATLANNAPGDVRIGAGEAINFAAGTTQSNAGLIEVIGGSVEFNGPLTNFASTGLIFGRGAALRFGAGLTNFGGVAISFGASDVFGDIDNRFSGVITVSGGGDATFLDDVTNNGTVRTSAGGNSVFLGAVSGGGAFPGTGTVFLEGDLRPGNSPGLIAFGGDLVLGSGAALVEEIAGPDSSQYDRTTVAHTAYLDGTLDVRLLNDFTPGSRQSFTILAAGATVGRFSQVILPPTNPALSIRYTGAEVILTTCPIDFNADGDINADDLGDYITCYFTSPPCAGAEFNNDGDLNADDLGDFITAYFSGC